MKKILTVEGMTCGHCVGHVESALKEVEGVTAVEVNLEAKKAVVESVGDIDAESLKKAVAEAGYSVSAVAEG
jgi:copper ion binding protein